MKQPVKVHVIYTCVAAIRNNRIEFWDVNPQDPQEKVAIYVNLSRGQPGVYTGVYTENAWHSAQYARGWYLAAKVPPAESHGMTEALMRYLETHELKLHRDAKR